MLCADSAGPPADVAVHENVIPRISTTRQGEKGPGPRASSGVGVAWSASTTGSVAAAAQRFVPVFLLANSWGVTLSLTS